MVPPSPSSSLGWGLLGERMLGFPIGPTHMCESTGTPHPSQTASPEASQGTHRVNRASASCLGSFSLSSANSL